MSRDPEAPGFKPMDRKAAAAHDRHFADDYVRAPDLPTPISATLATQLGYKVKRPAFTAASEPDDGQVADDYRHD
jgi:hypothetical protein